MAVWPASCPQAAWHCALLQRALLHAGCTWTAALTPPAPRLSEMGHQPHPSPLPGWYTAAFDSLVLSQLATQMAQAGVQARGIGRMGAAEAQELARRGRQLATAVSSYGTRLKPWLSGGLQPVYQGWVMQAALLGGAPPSRTPGALPHSRWRAPGLSCGIASSG